MKKTLKVLTSVLTLLTANGIANAEGTMGVDLTIGAGCALSGSPVGSIISDFAGLSFGTHSSLDKAIEGSATPLSLACSTGTHYKVELDNGRNATGEWPAPLVLSSAISYSRMLPTLPTGAALPKP